MSDDNPDFCPPDVDPALWAEFQRLSAHMHDGYVKRDGRDGPSIRINLNIPEEWAFFFAWKRQRWHDWRWGKNGATGIDFKFSQLPDRRIRRLAKSEIGLMLAEIYLNDWKDLEEGRSPLLRPRPPD